MKEKTLKEKAFSGFSWSLADKLFQQVFVFISGIVLARILDKENYGLMGILTIFVAMANLLQESGFGVALIRKRNTTQDDYITTFYTNITISISLYLILFFSAPYISDYYDKPILTPLARFLFLSFLFNSFGSIQNALLIKEVNYKEIAKINLISVFISYSVSLVLAFLGFGVWALAAQIVVLSFFRTGGLWIWGGWRPSGAFSFKIFKEFYSFSFKLIIANLLNSISTNIPQNIIAKQYSFGITGLYNQANRLYNVVTSFLLGTILNVPFTVLSQIEEISRFKKAVRKFMRANALIIFPTYMGMILIAQPFILSLLGEKWIEAAPILQLLSVGGLFYSLDVINNDILKIKGKSGVILFLDMIRNLLLFLAIAITLIFKYHYLYLVAGLSLTYAVRYIMGACYINKVIQYRILELMKDIFPYMFVAFFAVICGYFLKYVISSQLLLFICQIVLVGFIYIGILYFGGSILVKEAIKTTLQKMPFKRN